MQSAEYEGADALQDVRSRHRTISRLLSSPYMHYVKWGKSIGRREVFHQCVHEAASLGLQSLFRAIVAVHNTPQTADQLATVQSHCSSRCNSNRRSGFHSVIAREGDLESDWVQGTICHAKLLGQAEGGAQVGSIEGSSSHYGLISVQMPAVHSPSST